VRSGQAHRLRHASLDGYVEDDAGGFDWAAPDEDVHTFFNDLEREVATYLYGRRMYETMAYWEHPPNLREQPRYLQEYAKIWQTAEKIVYSKPLSEVSTARTRIEPQFDPDAVRALKANASRVLTVGGPELAAQAIEAGLVDELELLLVPVLVGGGKRALPADGARVDLELLDERRFANGSVCLRHRIEAGR